MGQATVEKSRAAGRVIGDKAEDVGEATVKGTKKAGEAVKDVFDKDTEKEGSRTKK